MLQVQQVAVTVFQQNCALIYDSATMRGVVVDPGGDVPVILAAIGKIGMTVEAILITHGHLDHVGGVRDLQDALPARPPAIGPDPRDQPLMDALPQQAQMFGVPAVPALKPDRYLVHGDTVRIGDEEFEVRHAPGHSPGHVILVAPARDFAILGDVLFHGSVGRTDFAYGDHATLMASIRDQVMTLPDDATFISGHGPSSTIGVERRTNPFLRG